MVSRFVNLRACHRLLLTAVAVLVLGGCGATEDTDSDPVDGTGGGPRVADARFDGEFEIVGLTIGGTEFSLEQRPTIEIDTEFGGLAVLPGCNTYFGSFSLAEDGAASFTVTGGSEANCGALADQERAILDALADTDQWVAVDAGFRFDGPDSSLSIAGPIG